MSKPVDTAVPIIGIFDATPEARSIRPPCISPLANLLKAYPKDNRRPN